MTKIQRVLVIVMLVVIMITIYGCSHIEPPDIVTDSDLHDTSYSFIRNNTELRIFDNADTVELAIGSPQKESRSMGCGNGRTSMSPVLKMQTLLYSEEMQLSLQRAKAPSRL